jgi:nucleotide-binding universal stress UspA family protein
MAVTVTEPWTAFVAGEGAMAFPVDDCDKGAGADAAAILAGMTTVAKKHNVTCAAVHVKNQFPAEGIIAACKDHGCDLIVMASHGRRGLVKLLLGSQATKVLTLSSVPVVIYR